MLFFSFEDLNIFEIKICYAILRCGFQFDIKWISVNYSLMILDLWTIVEYEHRILFHTVLV